MRDPCTLNRDSLDRRTDKVGWWLENTASIKNSHSSSGVVTQGGDAKDVAEKANKLCTFMQSSK